MLFSVIGVAEEVTVMIAIFWPLVIIITIVLYLLILITLPFSNVHATMFLFALVSFWSRIPGVGIPSPFYVLYLLDFVDFFSLIIAINIGGVPGAIFSLFGNLAGRAVGVWPDFMIVWQDSLAQALVCLVIPFLHILMGGDIFVSMIVYSVLRLLLNIPMWYIFPDGTSFARLIFELVTTGGALIFINGFYAKLFGPFFDSLLERGVQFSWILFLFVTVIVILGYMVMYRKSERKISLMNGFKNLFRYGIKGLKRHILRTESLNAAEEPSSHVKDLSYYIEKRLREGHSHSAIRVIILKQGWSEEHIRQAYEHRQKK